MNTYVYVGLDGKDILSKRRLFKIAKWAMLAEFVCCQTPLAWRTNWHWHCLTTPQKENTSSYSISGHLLYLEHLLPKIIRNGWNCCCSHRHIRTWRTASSWLPTEGRWREGLRKTARSRSSSTTWWGEGSGLALQCLDNVASHLGSVYFIYVINVSIKTIHLG